MHGKKYPTSVTTAQMNKTIGPKCVLMERETFLLFIIFYYFPLLTCIWKLMKLSSLFLFPSVHLCAVSNAKTQK